MRIKKRIEGTATAKVTMPIVGKIKIGTKSEKGFPMSLDYFLCYTENQQYKQRFVDAYGEKPKTIKIVFPSDDMNEVCRNYYEIRSASGKTYARGDGETFEVAMPLNGRVIFTTITESQICAKYGTVDIWMQEVEKKLATEKVKPKWAEKLTLKFVVLGINITGLWQFDTGGKDSTIPTIIGHIDDIVKKTGGKLSDIPFDLHVKKCKSDKEGDSKQYSVVSLVCNYDQDDFRSVAALPTSSFFGVLTHEKLKEISQRPTAYLDAVEGECEIVE